ncbi:DNA cytosine methyltransferase [Actinomadura sp. BRA 177]|uniref:DNA cytosine methyltransferase n=1 Tax=Actinomadura sp. BRA 177 TaxID=2745202 RepID=UPI0015958D61|nr:DNA cytosine methyltransferase [Actinomadura sp. BRA 177]NVI93146.1 DNA cytosine methyltransferase [Actinomadura sp. BRA 177]
MTHMTVLEGFAGAGGLSEGARMIGLAPTLGYETNPDACRTAHAAGHPRVQADVRALDPARLADAEGWISGPPCPTYAASGKRSGRTDYATVLTAVEHLADSHHPRRTLDGIGAEVADPRTALVLEALDVALDAPNLRWVVAEQVPAVAGIWREFAAELAACHRWDACTVLTLRADDFGAATRRTRVFLIATRDGAPDLTGLPYRDRWDCHRFGPGPTDRPPNPITPFPLTSMAAARGWPDGVRVNTRGNRRTSGGNEFAADRPALSLTGNGARTWYRTDLGPVAGRLTDHDAGRLQTFPSDYPWQGSRSSRFQRIADAVPPVMAAAVLGAATRRPWQPAVWQRLTEVYGHTRPATPHTRSGLDCPASPQLDLFVLPTGEGAAA